jgi:hypothetical protein
MIYNFRPIELPVTSEPRVMEVTKCLLQVMVINIWFPVAIKMYETAPSKTVWVFSWLYHLDTKRNQKFKYHIFAHIHNT